MALRALPSVLMVVVFSVCLLLFSQLTLWGRATAPLHPPNSRARAPPRSPAPPILTASSSSSPHIGSRSPLGPRFTRDSSGSSFKLPVLCQANAALAAYLTDYITAPKQGMLVWSCPPDKRCGGYGDRMKGITSGFLIALLTRRAFGIWHTDPVELRGLLRPAGPVPWDQLPANRSYPVRIKDKPPRSGKDVITKMPATVWLETNQDLVEYLQSLPAYTATLAQMGIGSRCTDMSCIYGCLFDMLFAVGDDIQGNLSQALALHPQFVSVQVRTGGGEISGWSDPMRTSHYVVDRMWDVVDAHRRNHCPQCHIFLTTDSASQQKGAMRRYGAEVFFVEGAITHSDRSSQEKAARGFPKVVMDNLLIGEAQYGVISNSGFSYTAVWRTKLNVTVVRMNKQRTGYYVEPRLYNNPLTSWTVVDAPFIPLPNA